MKILCVCSLTHRMWTVGTSHAIGRLFKLAITPLAPFMRKMIVIGLKENKQDGAFLPYCRMITGAARPFPNADTALWR